MILDHLDHRASYARLGRRISQAMDFLRDPATLKLEPPALGPENRLRMMIDGDDVFALVQRYRTKPPVDAFWEAHRKYIDVQCVIEGVERMGCVNLDAMRVVKAHDADQDFAVLEPVNPHAANFIKVQAGSFAIFFPHDVHMPGLIAGVQPIEVKKIVVKVRV